MESVKRVKNCKKFTNDTKIDHRRRKRKITTVSIESNFDSRILSERIHEGIRLTS